MCASTCSHLHEWIAALTNRVACRHLHFIDALVEPFLQLRLLLLHLECNDALSAPAMPTELQSVIQADRH